MPNLTDNDLENEKDMRIFLLKKYKIELFYFALVGISIGALSFYGLIDTCTTGALFGAALGYFVSDIRKLHS